MNETLYRLCVHAVNIMGGWHPIPARFIAESTGVRLFTARRRLRELKESGLAKTFANRLIQTVNLLCLIGDGELQTKQEKQKNTRKHIQRNWNSEKKFGLI